MVHGEMGWARAVSCQFGFEALFVTNQCHGHAVMACCSQTPGDLGERCMVPSHRIDCDPAH